MPGLTLVLVVALSAGVLVFLSGFFIWRRFFFRGRNDLVHTINPKAPSLRAAGVPNVQKAVSVHHQPDFSDGKRRGNQHVFPRGSSVKPLFSWADYPSLINDAVENGWSQFAFTGTTSTPTRSTLLGLCAVVEHGKETEADINWEVCQGSLEFMQKIALNSDLKRVSTSRRCTAASVIRTALPLPGPSLGNNSAFPQEAYFEITILHSPGDDDEAVGKVKEGEKIKLIQDDSNAKATSDSLIHVTSSHKLNDLEELKVDSDESRCFDTVKVSLGLTTGGSLPSKLPGCYPGSIGFNSNGSLYVDGIKLVFESKDGEWGRKDKVIGCGFDPRQKKVFFTVDSTLVHVVHCKSQEFGAPLYPTIAANAELVVLVNMGQSIFKYVPANAQRTPNPCFIQPSSYSQAIDMSYEDSRDLFSMTLDPQCLNAYTMKGSQNGTNKQGKGSDNDTEVELFEIVLEDGERSSNAAL